MTTPQERNRERAERAGWRLDEVCQCEEPRVAWGGGDGYIIPSGCWRCKRRARHIVVGEVPDETYAVRTDLLKGDA